MPHYQNYVFISYSDADKSDVHEFISILKDNFGINVWKDVEEDVIETLKSCPKASKGVIGAKLILCCLSKAYFKSEICQNQLKIANGFHKEIIFIMLEDFQIQNYLDESVYKNRVISRIYKNHHKISLWMGHQYEKLLEYISYVFDLKLNKEIIDDISTNNSNMSIIDNSKLEKSVNNSIFKYFAKQNGSDKKLKDLRISSDSSYYLNVQSAIKKLENLDQYQSFKSYKTIFVKSVSHGRISFLPKCNRILLTDEFSREVKLFDSDGSLLKAFNPENMLIRPYSVCSTHKDKIIIGDKGNEGIFIFNSRFDFLTHFGKSVKSSTTYLCADNNNSALIYSTHCLDNEFIVWNIDDEQIVAQLNLDKPEYIFVKYDKIYVTSSTMFEAEDSRKSSIVKIKSGLNCLYIIDKWTMVMERKIEFRDWLQPSGLYVDDEETIYTTAYVWDTNHVKSESKYLHTISKNGDIERKICLNGIKNFDDMIIKSNKIIFYVWQALKIIEFH